MSNDSYNYIYGKLVEDENDIFGILAYSIYKRQKIEYLSNFKEINGRAITDADLEHFKQISNSETQLNLYEDQAVQLATDFLEEALEQDLDLREIEFSQRVHTEISKLSNKFWPGVFQSLVGSIMFVLFVGVIIFFTWSYNQGIEKAIESTFDIQIIHNIKPLPATDNATPLSDNAAPTTDDTTPSNDSDKPTNDNATTSDTSQGDNADQVTESH